MLLTLLLPQHSFFYRRTHQHLKKNLRQAYTELDQAFHQATLQSRTALRRHGGGDGGGGGSGGERLAKEISEKVLLARLHVVDVKIQMWQEMARVSEETQRHLRTRLAQHARGMSERLGVVEGGEEYEFDRDTYPEHHVPSSTPLLTTKEKVGV